MDTSRHLEVLRDALQTAKNFDDYRRGIDALASAGLLRTPGMQECTTAEREWMDAEAAYIADGGGTWPRYEAALAAVKAERARASKSEPVEWSVQTEVDAPPITLPAGGGVVTERMTEEAFREAVADLNRRAPLAFVVDADKSAGLVGFRVPPQPRYTVERMRVRIEHEPLASAQHSETIAQAACDAANREHAARLNAEVGDGK